MSFDKILIVDDEPSIHRLLEYHLRRQQYKVTLVETLAKAEACLKEERFDLLLLDYCLPDGEGLELLKRFPPRPGGPLVVMMSAHGSAETAIACIRAGAFDYIIKPFALEELDLVIDRAASSRPPEPPRTEAGGGGDPALMALVGGAPKMVALREMLQKVAPTETPVLIRGESGTMKECVAELLHRASPRAERPMLKINCGAGTEERIERELFGDAETGACGLVELAQGGTLLLEEVSELSPRIQVRMLRVMQGRQEERGASDFRLIATTQRDLEELAGKGLFRHDFFLRLNVFPLQVPALRDRVDDIPALAACWREAFEKRHGNRWGGISEEAMRRLCVYRWPGNVNELENALERAVILAGCGRRLEADDFDFLNTAAQRNAVKAGEAAEPLLTLNELEKRHVLRALEYTNQNRTRAAGLLKISVRTLRNKLHQYRQEDGGLPALGRPGHLATLSHSTGAQSGFARAPGVEA